MDLDSLKPVVLQIYFFFFSTPHPVGKSPFSSTISTDAPPLITWTAIILPLLPPLTWDSSPSLLYLWLPCNLLFKHQPGCCVWNLIWFLPLVEQTFFRATHLRQGASQHRYHRIKQPTSPDTIPSLNSPPNAMPLTLFIQVSIDSVLLLRKK